MDECSRASIERLENGLEVDLDEGWIPYDGSLDDPPYNSYLNYERQEFVLRGDTDMDNLRGRDATRLWDWYECDKSEHDILAYRLVGGELKG